MTLVIPDVLAESCGTRQALAGQDGADRAVAQHDDAVAGLSQLCGGE